MPRYARDIVLQQDELWVEGERERREHCLEKHSVRDSIREKLDSMSATEVIEGIAQKAVNQQEVETSN